MPPDKKRLGVGDILLSAGNAPTMKVAVAVVVVAGAGFVPHAEVDSDLLVPAAENFVVVVVAVVATVALAVSLAGVVAAVDMAVFGGSSGVVQLVVVVDVGVDVAVGAIVAVALSKNVVFVVVAVVLR